MIDTEEIISTFNKHGYKYIKKLGSGGFGVVYLAEERISQHKFAIKRLNVHREENQEDILREILALAPINHPNIINYKNSFQEAGKLYLVMEYCSQGSLDEKLLKRSGMPLNKLVDIFLVLTKAMEFLHKKEIVHHDIKPSNILINEEDQLKISDFGCINTQVGTIIYKAPELRFNSSNIMDPRIDIYSLGMTLMECALGRHPLKGLSQDEQIVMVMDGDYPIGSLPVWLQEIILKACSFKPENRFQSMLEFNEALKNKNIPVFINKELIDGELIAKKLAHHNKFRRWIAAKKIIDAHYQEDCTILNLNIQAGKYFLNTHQLDRAKKAFEQALSLNRNAPIEKEIAEVYIQRREPAKATALLNNYLNKNFFDLEAHNQMLHAYFLSERWDIGYEQAKFIWQVFPNHSIVANNLTLFDFLINRVPVFHKKLDYKNPFVKYNFEDIRENNNPASWYWDERPLLKTKLLFQEYRFAKIDDTTNKIEVQIGKETQTTKDKIITFGREGYKYNTFSNFPGTGVSRRHFLIINHKNNVWLYDLASTGIRVDGKKVEYKCFLNGLHEVEFGGYMIRVKSDSGLLV